MPLGGSRSVDPGIRSLGPWLEGAPSNFTDGVSLLLFVDSCMVGDKPAT